MQIRWTDSRLVFTTEFGGPVVPRNLLRAVELAAANVGTSVKPGNVPALEDQLRPKGSAEDALTRYESALQATADDLTKLVPGLTWQWNRDAKLLDCDGEFAETRGVRVITRNLVSNGPIPDDLDRSP